MRVILIIIAYIIIGYVVGMCLAAYQDDTFGIDYLFLGQMWLPLIAILPIALLCKIIQYVGNLLSIIPVAIIAITKSKKQSDLSS